MARPIAVLMLLAAVAVALSACGVRGPLQPPPGATEESGAVDPDEPKQHKDFVLDGIL